MSKKAKQYILHTMHPKRMLIDLLNYFWTKSLLNIKQFVKYLWNFVLFISLTGDMTKAITVIMIDWTIGFRHFFLRLFVYHFSIYKEKAKLIAPYTCSNSIFFVIKSHEVPPSGRFLFISLHVINVYMY